MVKTGVYNPPRPTVGKLKRLYGKPPWILEVDDYEVIPEDATDSIGAIVWRNRVFTATGTDFKEGRC